MAERIETFQVPVASSTPEASPVDTALTMAPGRIEAIEVFIPAGHAGLTGLALVHSGQQVIPFAAGSWIVGDGETIKWTVARFPTGDAWQARTFNTDTVPHTFYLRVLLNELRLAGEVAGPIAAPLTL